MRKVTQLMLVPLLGCASQTPNARMSGEAANVPPAPSVDMTRCDPKGKRVQDLDTNMDGKPDLWKMYAQTITGGQRVEVQVCKEIDLNHDGKVDSIAYF